MIALRSASFEQTQLDGYLLNTNRETQEVHHGGEQLMESTRIVKTTQTAVASVHKQPKS